jgi:hypothetical protein
VISGFKPAILLDSNIQINSENLNKIKLESLYINNCKGNIFTVDNSNDDLESHYGQPAFNIVYSSGNNSETFIDFSNEKRPDFLYNYQNLQHQNRLYGNKLMSKHHKY